MSRTILIESCGPQRKLLALNLEVFVGSEVVNKYNADETIDFLKEDNDIQLIICENMVGDENTILKVYYYVKSNKLDIPIILLGKNAKLLNEIEMIEKEDWRDIIRLAAKYLKVTAEKMAEEEVPDFFPISIRSFLPIDKTPVDVFIKVNEKYEVIFAKNETVDRVLVRQFIVDKTPTLYVRSDERLTFTNSFSTQTVEFLEKNDLSVQDRINATSTAFEKAHELIGRTGISEEAVLMAKTSINSMVKVAAGSAGISDLLEMIQDSEDSYLYRHSLLLSVVAHHVIGSMEWGNEDQKKKIVFTSFFHDITIPVDNLCSIHSDEEIESANLSPDNKKKVLNHALNASELIKTFPSVPFGVDTIILQHHGALNGIGFETAKMDNRVSPLAIVFMVVEDYVEYVLNTDKEFFKLNSILDILKAKYKKGTYIKVVDALEKAGRTKKS